LSNLHHKIDIGFLIAIVSMEEITPIEDERPVKKNTMIQDAYETTKAIGVFTVRDAKVHFELPEDEARRILQRTAKKYPSELVYGEDALWTREEWEKYTKEIKKEEKEAEKESPIEIEGKAEEKLEKEGFRDLRSELIAIKKKGKEETPKKREEEKSEDKKEKGRELAKKVGKTILTAIMNLGSTELGVGKPKKIAPKNKVAKTVTKSLINFGEEFFSTPKRSRKRKSSGLELFGSNIINDDFLGALVFGSPSPSSRRKRRNSSYSDLGFGLDLFDSGLGESLLFGSPPRRKRR